MNISFTLDEIKKIAQNLLESIDKKEVKNSTVIALSGDLGAGKTTLTQEIAKLLGVKEKIISPTFVIMKRYEVDNKNFKNLIHIDAYRLNSSQELLNLGWKELIEDKGNLIIVEWPERVPECLEGDICKVELGHEDEKTRTIKFLL